MAWPLTNMRAKFRKVVGKPSTNQITDGDIDALLNNYYRNTFPDEVSPPELRGWYTFNTADGTQTQAISDDVLSVEAPAYVANERVVLYTDEGEFFDDYPMSVTTESQPESILLFDRTLYLGPIPDDIYAVKIRCRNKPDELSEDDDTPTKDKWGPVIVYGAAVEHLMDGGDAEAAAEASRMYTVHLNSIHSAVVAQIPVGTRAKPRL